MAGRMLVRGIRMSTPLRLNLVFRQKGPVKRNLPSLQCCYCTAAAPSSSPSSTSPSSSSRSTTSSTPSSTSSTSSTPSSSSSSSSSPSPSSSSTTTSPSPSSSPSSSSSTPSAPSQDKALAKAPSMNPVLDIGPNDEDGFRERFIPLSRRSLIRKLMQEENFLTDSERKRFEEFAVAMDTAIGNQYYGVLAELKQLFDPLNPDKDTISSRLLGKREKEDSEFWLMQRLSALMESANFHELPNHVVKKALDEHVAGEGVNVSVNPKKYEILRFWALGKELPKDTTPWYTRMTKSLFYRASKRTPPPPVRYYKRIVVAVKPKGQDKLLLKMFKEIPTGALEQLLPDGKIRMSAFDQGFLALMVSVGSLSLLVKGVTVLADLKWNWMFIVTAATGVIALRAWNSYKNRRTHFMMQLSRTLYFKNVANNLGLLAVLVDRAQDESFKEALLAYAFLLTNRSSVEREAANEDPANVSALIGGLPGAALDKTIEQWVQETTGTTVSFNSTTAQSILRSFGILHADENDCLGVVPLDAAILSLPRQPVSMATRTEEAELHEGYDRIFNEDETTYRKEEKAQRRHGWS